MSDKYEWMGRNELLKEVRKLEIIIRGLKQTNRELENELLDLRNK